MQALELLAKKEARNAARAAKGLPIKGGWGKASKASKATKSKSKADSKAASASPRRGPTAYILFGSERRPALKEANPGATAQTITSQLAAEWRALGDEGQAAYQVKAQQAQEAAAEDGGVGSAATAAGGKKAAGKKSASKAGKAAGARSSSRGATPDGPAKPRSGYVAFCGARREAVKAANPGAQPKQILSLLAAEWRALSEVEKEEWKQSVSRSPSATAMVGAEALRAANGTHAHSEFEGEEEFERSPSPSPSPERAEQAEAAMALSSAGNGRKGAARAGTQRVRTTRSPVRAV